MLQTIRHGDSGQLIVVAKLLTGYLRITSKICDPDSYIKINNIFDADFVAYVVGWQSNHGCTADGVIGPDTWRAIAAQAPTCSTSKNRTSGPTMAVQILLDGNVTCDAIYGPRTKAAVAVYQDAHSLTADGICGPKTWNVFIVGEAKPEPGHFVQPKDFKQGAKPWGPRMYSNHNDHSQTMANSGCGPTADADVVATMKDPSVDPWTMAQLSLEMGDRTYNDGTKWTLFKPHTAEAYGFQKVVQTGSIDVAKACLDAGGYAVCSMRPGYWTRNGHFICAWKYTDTDMWCNDPASKDRTHQAIGQFKKECKQYFCFYPDAAPEPAKAPADANEVKRGDKICDVAKYQGKIDWDALAPELAFVVIKASGMYRNGADPQYVRNVTEAVKRGVPFHAYTFLYCTTESEAKRDARLFYDSVMAGGHMPLFWVLDCESGWGVADADAPRIARVFEDELRRLARQDIRVAIYVANEMYKTWKFDYDKFAYVWIPKYTKDPPSHPCDLWQYTDVGTLPGISGRVDLDMLMGTKPLSFFTGGD